MSSIPIMTPYCKNGLFSFSKPMLVSGPCPHNTAVSSGNTNNFSSILPINSAKLPPGKSVLPMLIWNNTSPENTALASLQ
ncbi:hypothetical protein protein [Bacillus cereus G9241]|nr:hypothetical protein protein [Bacillus cereus G9241]